MTKVVPSANDGAEQAVPKTLDPATVNWSDRPVPADGGVTRVSVELNVQEFKVDTHNGEFLQATFWVVLEWEDPRLLAAGIDTSDPSAMPKDIWRPAACFPTNFAWADDEPPVTFLSLAPGRLMWWRQTKPTHVDISSAGGGEERFRSFPFDSARIDWLFCMSDEVKLETDVDIELDFDRRNVKSQGGELRQMEWVGQRRQGEFVCTAVTFGVFKHSSPNTGLVYRDCIWSLHVQRDPTYYIFKGAVPIYVIVAFAFFQFAMDVDAQLTERLNFLVALMLSSFAIQWTVTDRLPRVPFVTALDRLIFASLLALFMMALGSVVESCVESTSELGYSSGHGDDVASMAWKLHAIEQTQLRRKYRVDGVGCPKFDFHTGHEPGRLQWQARRVRLRRYQKNPHVGQRMPMRDARRLRGHAHRYFAACTRVHEAEG